MLSALAPDLWIATASIKFGGGVRFPLVMAVARLPDGGVALVSPIPMDDALAAEVAAVGPVRFVVAPNRYHHLYAGAALERFPAARLVGVPGLAAKRPDLRFDATLGEGASPFGEGLAAHVIAGAPRIAEAALFHPASRTVMVVDLVFNVVSPETVMTRLALRLTGAHRGLARSRIWRFLIKDRAAFDRSMDAILAWDFDRLVMSHGAPIDGDARVQLAGALGRDPA